MPSRALPCERVGFQGSIDRSGSNSIAKLPAPDRPLPLSQSLLAHSSSQPVVWQTGSPLFCVDLFEDVNLHGLVGPRCLSRKFSSSNALSLLASLTSIPPNFL